MAEDLRIETHNKEGEWLLFLTGDISENAVFPEAGGALPMRIDLNGVEHINSIGIRSWCIWLKKQASRPKITLERCPFIIARFFSVIREALPANVVVESFYVPFISNTTNERKDVLFRLGIEYDQAGNLKIPKVTDDTGEELEMDVLQESYFQFLNK